MRERNGPTAVFHASLIVSQKPPHSASHQLVFQIVKGALKE